MGRRSLSGRCGRRRESFVGIDGGDLDGHAAVVLAVAVVVAVSAVMVGGNGFVGGVVDFVGEADGRAKDVTGHGHSLHRDALSPSTSASREERTSPSGCSP